VSRYTDARADGIPRRHDPLTPCCDLHNRNCEPPSELCCWECTEATHPDHRDGSACIAPDLSNARERERRHDSTQARHSSRWWSMTGYGADGSWWVWLGRENPGGAT